MGSGQARDGAPALSGVPVQVDGRRAALDALLGELGALRLTLGTDLSLAAGAVEEGADGLAGALVQGDRADLAAFEQRALRHLRTLEQGR